MLVEAASDGNGWLDLNMVEFDGDVGLLFKLPELAATEEDAAERATEDLFIEEEAEDGEGETMDEGP